MSFGYLLLSPKFVLFSATLIIGNLIRPFVSEIANLGKAVKVIVLQIVLAKSIKKGSVIGIQVQIQGQNNNPKYGSKSARV